jgi:preprotein translocase subunit SecY
MEQPMSKGVAFLAQFWKAIVAFIAPAAPLLVSAVQESSRGGTQITQVEWVYVVATCVVTAAAVYAAPKNKPKTEGGAVDVVLLLLVATFALVLLMFFGVRVR